MSAKGFYLAQDGHVVPLIAPSSISGGSTGNVFCMEGYAHASILILIGAQAAAATKIIVNACTDASGDNATAIPFNLFAQETAGLDNDVLGTRVSVLAAGYTPSSNANIFYVIEIDAEDLPQGSPYVELSITNGANVDYWSAAAILSGGRYTGDQSPSATS